MRSSSASETLQSDQYLSSSGTRQQKRIHVSFAARRKTVTTLVGGVPVGSSAPIVVQSMTNTDTADAVSTAKQVVALATAGSQLVRVTVNNEEAAAAVPEIVERA